MMDEIPRIKEAVTIEEALLHFGVEIPPKGRDPVMVRCPWHEDKNPSMAVYLKKGKAWCYACNLGGDVLDITALFLEVDLKGATDYWARRLGLSPKRLLCREEQDLLRQEARKWRERNLIRKIARTASIRAEHGLPRPRGVGEFPLYDRVYARKDKLDSGLPWVEDRATLILYLRGLQKWRVAARRALGGGYGLYKVSKTHQEGQGKSRTAHSLQPERSNARATAK